MPNNIKLNEQIEEKAWYLWENSGWETAVNYLLSLGFSEDEIDYMMEQWSDGKSFYPYN